MTKLSLKAGINTGAQLALARKAAGLSQTALAAKAGIGRHAVSYWECKRRIDPKAWAVLRMAEAETAIANMLRSDVHNTRGRGMGIGAKESLPGFGRPKGRISDKPSLSDEIYAEAITKALAEMRERESQRLARRRVVCGAKTTRKGTPCMNKSEPGRRRCKFHGGMSTGPKTPEGRERIAEAMRKRWAKWRRDPKIP